MDDKRDLVWMAQESRQPDVEAEAPHSDAVWQLRCAQWRRASDQREAELLFMPPNTTWLIQPMDQGIIANFKGHYRSLVLRQLMTAIDQDNESSMRAAELSKKLMLLDSVHMAKEAWGSHYNGNDLCQLLSAGQLRQRRRRRRGWFCPGCYGGDGRGPTSRRDCRPRVLTLRRRPSTVTCRSQLTAGRRDLCPSAGVSGRRWGAVGWRGGQHGQQHGGRLVLMTAARRPPSPTTQFAACARCRLI